MALRVALAEHEDDPATGVGGAGAGTDAGAGEGLSFFEGVARAKMSSSGVSSTFLRLPMTSLGIGRSFSFSVATAIRCLRS